MSARLHLFRTAAPAVNWDAVYWDTMPRVYNFFRYRVGDDALAEDLTATTFVKAWRARDRYASDVAAFSTWLFSIAHNVAVDHFRHHHSGVPLDDLPHLADENPIEDLIQRRADSARLKTLLERLTPRERELIALKYGAELTNRAIAEVTGLSESNVGTTLHRIIQKLRQQWDE
ncbi:MAG: sigma-70 family RNA polymerase sigma factor [Chloroflexi bacterium]|nr:sigma-70 family RNA polymerase sigma factor [Chloroflexota bacterium]